MIRNEGEKETVIEQKNKRMIKLLFVMKAVIFLQQKLYESPASQLFLRVQLQTPNQLASAYYYQ